MVPSTYEARFPLAMRAEANWMLFAINLGARLEFADLLEVDARTRVPLDDSDWLTLAGVVSIGDA